VTTSDKWKKFTILVTHSTLFSAADEAGRSAVLLVESTTVRKTWVKRFPRSAHDLIDRNRR